MAAFRSDGGERLRIERIDLDPEDIHILDFTQDAEIALGPRIEVEVEQDVDVRTRSLAHDRQVFAQAVENIALDIALRRMRASEARRPALDAAVVIAEDVGLERRKTFLADLAGDLARAIRVLDRRF